MPLWCDSAAEMVLTMSSLLVTGKYPFLLPACVLVGEARGDGMHEVASGVEDTDDGVESGEAVEAGSAPNVRAIRRRRIDWRGDSE